ncbi:hypothetical protein I2494_18085 [Budviciaceae bacterium BWR-B9]|uniref:Uncharacterized protein n=1 Tax=Limnobaculum allomyrinae TaxID=2791986 RepID=A0ABS1IUZ7_9GAMM|nr:MULTISPECIES: hypothetical protein [Limnobaculum]MBK5145589.1 hypothetical protein [Limnobaculum allomyrinae]MBV7693708.1 hypothetical protein [Limnobaculum sp. M2-1]
MEKEKAAPITIEIDISAIQEKIDILTNELLEFGVTAFDGSSESFTDAILNDISAMCNNIILSDLSPAVVTNGTMQIIQRTDFGIEFERLITTIRTAKLNLAHK